MENINAKSYFQREEKTYMSYDSPYSKTIDGNPLNLTFTIVHIGVTVMLLRNIDTQLGLCNGTRLIIIKMGKFVLEENVISGSNIGEKVFIPMLSLIHFDVKKSLSCLSEDNFLC